MPLDKPTLKADIITLTETLFSRSQTMSPAQAREAFADGLANAVEKFVKSGDGVYQAGKLTAGATAVTAVGSPAIKIV